LSTDDLELIENALRANKFALSQTVLKAQSYDCNWAPAAPYWLAFPIVNTWCKLRNSIGLSIGFGRFWDFFCRFFSMHLYAA
ncbi:MAG: hypothetical protein AAFU82_16055, partial [Pseudomonadota bacterium]